VTKRALKLKTRVSKHVIDREVDGKRMRVEHYSVFVVGASKLEPAQFFVAYEIDDAGNAMPENGVQIGDDERVRFMQCGREI